MGEVFRFPGGKKIWQWDTENLVLEEGDALFVLSENGASQKLYLTKENSWPAFIARIIVHVLHDQSIFDQCANDCLSKMSTEEKTTFKDILKNSNYVD